MNHTKNQTLEIMKQTTSHSILTAILMLLVPMAAEAYDMVLDGIYYNLVGDHAVVTNNGNYNCYSGDVVIPETVTKRGITYPVTIIGEDAFLDCGGLKSVTLPNSVTVIWDYAFYRCTNLASITLGDSLKIVGCSAFELCSALTSIILPNSVTTIEDYAFENCGRLATVAIGSNVTSIGYFAFYGCSQLTNVISLAITPPAVNSPGLFDNMNLYAHASLYVLPRSLQAYQSASYWKDFSQILEIDTTGDVNGDGEVTIGDANNVTEVIVNGGTGKGHTRVPGGVVVEIMVCDVNGDGEINIADINAIIDIILKD